MAGMLTIGTSLLGAGSALGGMFGGTPTQNVQLPPQFNMPNMGDAAGGAFGAANTMAGMPNIPQQLYPQFSAAAGNILNNPGAGNMLQHAGQAGAMGTGAANNQYGMGSFLTSMGAGMVPYAGQILNTGFDPQNQLYDRTQQQLQEQTRAGQAARGLGNSPFGAGLENKAMSDFNIDWQNNQLGRQATAAGAAGGLFSGAGNAITSGANMMSAAPGTMMQAGMYPYSAYNQIGGDQFNALNTLSGAGLNMMTTPQMQEQAYLQYLQAGNQSGQVANQGAQNAINQGNATFNQQQTLGAQFGKSLAGLGGAFGGGGSSGGGSSFMPSSSFMNNSWGW